MPTTDTNNNIIVTIYDGIATLGTDYDTSGITPGIHIPFSKMVWGNEYYSYRVGDEYPMPIDVKSFLGSSGAGYLLGITGNVFGLGTFTVGNTKTSPLYVAGLGITNTDFPPVNIYGQVQGITSGILVGVTVGPIVFGTTMIGVFGISGAAAITITGGRFLGSSTDSVSSNSKIVGISMSTGLLGFTLDSIKIFGPTGQPYIPSVLNYMDGNTLAPIGMSGDSLKVSIVNTGITFTLNLTSTIGVTNASESPLKIQGGTASDNPVLIKYYNSSTVPISTPYPISAQIVSVGSTFGAQIDSIISAISGTTGNIAAIKNNTNIISTINDKISSGGINVKVTEVLKSSRIQNNAITFTDISVKAITIGSTVVLKSGVNLKAPSTNTSTVYIGSDIIIANKDAAYPLEPGESIFIECNSTNIIYCCAKIDPTKQKLIYIAS